ncbi:MAG: helix-turn-helix transcriptional regulator [Bacilli bacterium]|nr:helix-turn-helix transcriptional regulator [Bacilli bacterium]
MFSNDLVINILNYLDNNLYTQISINEISNFFKYNKDYIMRLFKKEINITIIDYINTKRIFLSLKKIRNTNDSILKTSLDAGFSSQEYFCEMFHKIIGVSPSKYRKSIKVGNDLSISDKNIIRKNIIKLSYLFNNVDKYKKNIPPKNTVKVLSIFK